MGEYKPRRLGDSFASTTPRRGNAPTTQVSDLEVAQKIFVTGQYIPYTGSNATSAFSSSALLYIVPLSPLPCDFTLNYARVRVTTSSASNGGRTAIYQYDNGGLTKITGSEAFFPADAGSVAVTVSTAFTLSKDYQYFLASMATNTTATFSVFSMSDSSPRSTPYYTASITGSTYVTGKLPSNIALSTLTKNYTNNSIVALATTYFSSDMLNFL